MDYKTLEGKDEIIAQVRTRNAYLEEACERLRVERDTLREAMQRLARLGNGDRYGNSEGNAIAITALGMVPSEVHNQL